MPDSRTASRWDSHPDANLLSAYAEGRLPRGERDGILVHVADCDVCRQITYLIHLTEPRKGIDQQKPRIIGLRWWTWTRLATPLACAILLLCFVNYYADRTTPHKGQPASFAQHGRSEPVFHAAHALLPKRVSRVRQGGVSGVSSTSRAVRFSPAPPGAWEQASTSVANTTDEGKCSDESGQSKPGACAPFAKPMACRYSNGLIGAPLQRVAVAELAVRIPALKMHTAAVARTPQAEAAFLRIETPRYFAPLKPLPKISLHSESVRNWTHLCSNDVALGGLPVRFASAGQRWARIELNVARHWLPLGPASAVTSKL